MRASRVLLIILLFIAGYAITMETSGKQNKLIQVIAVGTKESTIAVT